MGGATHDGGKRASSEEIGYHDQGNPDCQLQSTKPEVLRSAPGIDGPSQSQAF